MDTINHDSDISPLPYRTLKLHFGELIILDSNLHSYEEHVFNEGVLRNMERSVYPTKKLLLKIGSAYLESFSSRDELDMDVPVAFTEDELWTMRQSFNVGAMYNGVLLGPELKRKIYSALVDIHNDDTDLVYNIEDILRN